MESSILWNYIFERYEALVEEGFNYSLQLKLVKQIAASQYADFLYPSTSHFALVISPEGNYNERLNLPSIALQQLDEQRFEVVYSPKRIQTHNTLKRILHHLEVWSYLESLILKLKLSSEEIKTN